MTLHATVRRDHLQRVAGCVERITNLPAVATQDWCDRAARAILAIRSDALASVTIGQFGPAGELVDLEITGTATAENGHLPGRYVHSETTHSLGWWLGTQESLAAGQLSVLQAASPWRLSPAGRRWSDLGVRDLVVGQCLLSDRPQPGYGRYLIVELGVRDMLSDSLEAGDAEVLLAALPSMGKRAIMAFGTESTTAVNRITPREQLILEQLSLGRTVKQIAEELNRSPHTVHDHVKSLHRKLGAASRGELIARALGHIEHTMGDRPGNNFSGPTIHSIQPGKSQNGLRSASARYINA